jgi:hypothetical protein
MNQKLIRIARYLANNGFYKEAAQLQKIGQENTDDLYDIYYGDQNLTDLLYEAARKAGKDEDQYMSPGDSELKVGSEFISIMKATRREGRVAAAQAVEKIVAELGDRDLDEQQKKDLEEYGEVWDTGPGAKYKCRVSGLSLDRDELETLKDLLLSVIELP